MEAYMHTGDPDKAFQCYYRIKDMIRQFYLYDFLLINYHHAAARLFLMINDHRKCEIQLRLAEMITSKSKNIRDMASTENIAYQLDSARKRPWQAMAHLSRYKQLNDSLNRRNHDRELSQLQIEYEMAKKDLDIASLKQRTLLQDRALSSEKLVRNLSVSGMLFFVIFTAVLYRSYRSKQKINKELNVKQQEVNAHNQSLRHLLNERGWLIKEVHHRVKNNFQIVISLLDSQSSFISDDAAMDVLRESRNRMHSISLVHQKLYQDESLKGINIKEYVIELTDILKDSFGISSWIRFEYDLPGLLLDASQIVPLGLIVNEAVTNAIKYAFKDRSDCVIHISVAETPDGLMEISIMDNGCGLPADFNVDQCTSLGMNLICGLTKQLQGELSMTTTIGLAIKVRLRRLKTLGSEYTSPSAVLAHA
ncbi:hypothetical protein GCM10023149_16050 [Mucilaginibacter gynuensis]|uniref:histidine kinase n=2 Tax=Mucilaginibacter gynuensis TaxID=1302236 RepID=A0ABP8G694_9SPHI